MVEDYRDAIEQGVVVARPVLCGLDNAYRVDWKSCSGTDWDQAVDTGVAEGRAAGPGGARCCEVPAGFELHPRVAKIWEERRKMAARRPAARTGASPRTWPTPPCWTPAIPVRLSGQDCGRGTFFHRHAKIHDQADRRRLHPAPAHGPPPGRLHRHRLDPLRGGGARLRVRLRHRRAQYPDPVGGPVRRLRQRRPGGDRPVHHLRPGPSGACAAAW